MGEGGGGDMNWLLAASRVLTQGGSEVGAVPHIGSSMRQEQMGRKNSKNP